MKKMIQKALLRISVSLSATTSINGKKQKRKICIRMYIFAAELAVLNKKLKQYAWKINEKPKHTINKVIFPI